MGLHGTLSAGTRLTFFLNSERTSFNPRKGRLAEQNEAIDENSIKIVVEKHSTKRGQRTAL